MHVVDVSFRMTAPASIHIEDQNRAEKLYSENHAGNLFLAYLAVLKLLTVILAIRSFLQLIQVVSYADSVIVEFGQVISFLALFAEVFWLYILARREDIKIAEYRPYMVDVGLAIFAFFFYLLAFAAGHNALGSLLNLVWLLPLTVRHFLLLKKLLLGDNSLGGLVPQP